MRPRLKDRPTVENAPKFAADMVGPAAEIRGAELDFSVASLKAINDGCLDGISPVTGRAGPQFPRPGMPC